MKINEPKVCKNFSHFRYLNMSSDDECQSACSMINMRADDINILDPFRYFMSAQLINKKSAIHVLLGLG